METDRAVDAATRRTYRYLRVGIVGMALLLAVSLVVELAGGVGQLESISAYYYTPVRPVLVGTLMAVGLSLVAIRGRDDVEDVLLNLAGMLAPVVALVPAPLLHAAGGRERVVPAEFRPEIDNNVTALLVVGAAGLAFAAWTAYRDPGGGRRAAVAGVAASAAAWVGCTLWFVLGRDSFVVAAHYAAAVPFFGCICLVAFLEAGATRGVSPGRARAYRLVACAMVATLAVAVLLFVGQALGDTPVESWVFWVEAVLLALFVAFWLVQTADHWRDGVSRRTPRSP